MGFQYTPYALLILLAGLISAILAGFIWSRRPGQGVISFVILMLGVTVWSVASGIELIATDIQTKLLITSLSFIAITIVPTAWLTFVLEYTGRDTWLQRNRVAWLAIYPIITISIVATNPWHHLFYTSVVLDPNYTDSVVAAYEHGILFWVHTIYAYVILLISAVLLVRSFIRSQELYRGQVTLLIIAQIAPWIANVIFIAGYSPFPDYVDLTPLAFTITGIATGWSLYRFRLMDIIPVAHDTIFDSMNDAVFVVDTKARVVDANQAALTLLNLPKKDVIGRHNDDVFANRRDIVDKYRDVNSAQDEILIPVKDDIHTFTLRVSPLYNRYGDLSGRIAVLHDITLLKRKNHELELAREQANEATRLKSEFVATMSHELRTPLNAIIGYTDLLLAGMAGELTDTQYQYSERTLANGQHLLGLINDILDISKIEAGRLDLIQESFNIKDWVNKIVAQNKVLAEEKKIEFKTEIDANLPKVLIGDETKLYQISVNLLANAFKFTEESGTVTFTIGCNTDDTWKITVTDTGIGIPPHEQETIFNEFHQIDGTTTRKFGGTGLGLAIVRKLTLLMGGTVRLSSVVGEGSTFTVVLPIIKTESNNLTT